MNSSMIVWKHIDLKLIGKGCEFDSSCSFFLFTIAEFLFIIMINVNASNYLKMDRKYKN